MNLIVSAILMGEWGFVAKKWNEFLQKRAHASGKPHECRFRKGDVLNYKITPRCTICGEELK